jgi:hypothetical protein
VQTAKFVYWEEHGAWIGYLQDYPDYWTQGETLDDLKDHLFDLYHDLTSGELPGIRKVDELVRLCVDVPWRQARLVSQSRHSRVPTDTTAS